MKEDIFFRYTQIDPSTSSNLFLSDHLKVAEYLGGLGDEDEKVIPIEISGTIGIDIQDTVDTTRAIVGEVYAVTHISTSAEQWVAVSDNTNRLLYSEMQNMFGDEFNYKKIGSVRQQDRANAFANYSYKFPKELRKLLDRKVTDPDFDPEFVIVIAIFLSRGLGSGDHLVYVGKHNLKYQIANRKLSDLPA